MARDHEDRYITAGELAADLRRVLNDEPILAKPPAAIDRARRWMRRHRATVFTAAATLLLAVFLAGALLWNERSQTLAAYAAEKEQHKIAQRNEAEAQRQAASGLRRAGRLPSPPLLVAAGPATLYSGSRVWNLVQEVDGVSWGTAPLRLRPLLARTDHVWLARKRAGPVRAERRDR